MHRHPAARLSGAAVTLLVPCAVLLGPSGSALAADPCPSPRATPPSSNGAYPPPSCGARTSSDTVRQGDRLTVSGAGFQPGERVDVFIGDRKVASGFADANGSFTLTFTVPIDFPVGKYTLYLIGASSGHTLTSGLRVLPRQASPSPTQTASGSGGGGSRGAGGGTGVKADSVQTASGGGGASSGLPFTGAEITSMAVGGAAVLGAGAFLVVAGRRRRTAE